MDDYVESGTLGALLVRRDRLRERLARAWEAHRPMVFIRRIEEHLWDTWNRIDEAEARDHRFRLLKDPGGRRCPVECA